MESERCGKWCLMVMIPSLIFYYPLGAHLASWLNQLSGFLLVVSILVYLCSCTHCWVRERDNRRSNR